MGREWWGYPSPVKHPRSAALLQVPAEPGPGRGFCQTPVLQAVQDCPLGKQCLADACYKHRLLGSLPTATDMSLQPLRWQLLQHQVSLGLPRCPSLTQPLCQPQAGPLRLC